jgi:hypothetical protein
LVSWEEVVVGQVEIGERFFENGQVTPGIVLEHKVHDFTVVNEALERGLVLI